MLIVNPWVTMEYNYFGNEIPAQSNIHLTSSNNFSENCPIGFNAEQKATLT